MFGFWRMEGILPSYIVWDSERISKEKEKTVQSVSAAAALCVWYNHIKCIR